MLTKVTPYLLYPLVVFIVCRLTYAYSKNPASPGKASGVLSWCLTMAFVIAAGVGLLCIPAAERHHWWYFRRDEGPFILAAVSVLSGVVCGGLAGKHLKLGRTGRSVAAFAGVVLGASGFTFMAYYAIFNQFLQSMPQ